MTSHASRGLRLIGCFKLLKAVLLTVAGLELLSLLDPERAVTFAAWVAQLKVDPREHVIHSLIERLLGIRRRTLESLGVGSLLYASVFATEGVGLWLGKRWAEYLTLSVTLSFLPIELYELWLHPNALKVTTIVINVMVAGYLARELRRTSG